MLLLPNLSKLGGHSGYLPKSIIRDFRAHHSQRQRTSSRKDERDERFLLDTSGNCIVFCWACNSATYADVRPPTVAHLIVAGSPEGWNHKSYQCAVFLTQSVCVPVSMDRYRLFSFLCPGVKRFR